MHVRRQLGIVLARLPLLISSVAIAAASAYFLSGLQPKVYEASATLIVGQSLSAINPDYNQLLVSQRLSETYATVATTRPVLARVIERLSLPGTPDALANRVSAVSETDGALLTINAQDRDPEGAAVLANTMAEELIAATPTVQGRQTELLDSIDEDIDAIQDDLAAAQAEIETLAALADRTSVQEARLDTLRGRVISLRQTYIALLAFAPTASSNLMTIIQPAVAPEGPIAPRPLLTGLLAAVVVFLLVSAAVFVVEYFDDAIRTPDEVEEAIGLPTLASIERMTGGSERPEIYRLATLLYPRSAAAEAYRALRTNIEFAAVDRPIDTLLVTSGVPGEGKTVTAANLAVVFAQAGRRVLLVDADLRKPGVHEIFAITNERGFTDLLRSDDTHLADVVRPTDQKNLNVLTAGPHPPNPAELLGSQRMRAILPSLVEAYDMVVFDSPPLEVFTDAAVLSASLDGTILVVESRRGRLAQIRAAREALSKASAQLMGVVLNGIPAKTPTEYGRYYDSSANAATGGEVAPVPNSTQQPPNVTPT